MESGHRRRRCQNNHYYYESNCRSVACAKRNAHQRKRLCRQRPFFASLVFFFIVRCDREMLAVSCDVRGARTETAQFCVRNIMFSVECRRRCDRLDGIRHESRRNTDSSKRNNAQPDYSSSLYWVIIIIKKCFKFFSGRLFLLATVPMRTLAF